MLVVIKHSEHRDSGPTLPFMQRAKIYKRYCNSVWRCMQRCSTLIPLVWMVDGEWYVASKHLLWWPILWPYSPLLICQESHGCLLIEGICGFWHLCYRVGIWFIWVLGQGPVSGLQFSHLVVLTTKTHLKIVHKKGNGLCAKARKMNAQYATKTSLVSEEPWCHWR